VRDDNPQKVSIDWTGYGSTTEAKAAIADARTIDEELNYARMPAKQKPKMQEKLRVSTWAGTSAMATVLLDGALACDVWEEQAQSNLRKALITPDQCAEARAIFESWVPGGVSALDYGFAEFDDDRWSGFDDDRWSGFGGISRPASDGTTPSKDQLFEPALRSLARPLAMAKNVGAHNPTKMPNRSA